MRIVTLVPTALARKGVSFKFRGLPPECKSCRLYFLCSRLRAKLTYEVIGIRNVKHKCKIHEEVQVAIVRIAPIKVMLPSHAAIPGLILKFPWIACKEKTCPNIRLCKPEGLRENDRVKVIKVYPTALRCRYRELKLALVSLLP